MNEKLTRNYPVEYDKYGIPYVKCWKCEYFDYDEFNYGDGEYGEFEVCRKGHELYPRKCGDGKWKKMNVL